MKFSIRDIQLAEEGQRKAEWSARQMPVVGILAEEGRISRQFEGLVVGCCLHITAETAALVSAIAGAGGRVCLCASNPLSTQDEIAAHLVAHRNIEVFGIRGDDEKSYYANIRSVIEQRPRLVIDDGADLIAALHADAGAAADIIGASEETTTGVIRLQNLARQGLLQFPIIAVNDARTKHFFDNRYGTGQSTLDGILRATNVLIAGKTAVVCGYGWCGKGIARRLDGAGARVIVTEVDPVRALEAAMDGYSVMPIHQAAGLGDILVTATGNTAVLSPSVINRLRDGAILANAGHFNVEIDVAYLKATARSQRRIRNFLDEYTLQDGRRVFLLGEGRLVNLACAEGHPASVMDMSFANQYLALEHLVRSERLKPAVYPVPEEIDTRVASLKLRAMQITIDTLTDEQDTYLSSWKTGT